jgi:hypothetical protein
VVEEFGREPQPPAQALASVVSLTPDESYTHVTIRVAGHVATAETAINVNEGDT